MSAPNPEATREGLDVLLLDEVSVISRERRLCTAALAESTDATML